MYKLVAVGGKLRGKEYILEDGENLVGRGHDNAVVVAIEGVSKKHMSITVNNTECFVEDLGSSNGTFVNGKLTKKITVKNGDKITLPNVIFQMVYVKENKTIITKKIAKASDKESDTGFQTVMPDNTLGKLKHNFKYRWMKVLYSFNEQYEWNALLGIILFLFILMNVGFTIGPVLVSSKSMLMREITARGKQYASEVARLNAIHLNRGELERIDTSFLEDSAENEGVVSYELFDMEGRIVRPASKIDRYTNDTFSVSAHKYFSSEKNYSKVRYSRLNNGEIGIAKPLLIYNNQTGSLEPVGVIAIHFKPKTLQSIATQDTSSYLQAVVVTSMIAVLFFGMIYYLTIRHIEYLKFQIEETLRGQRKELQTDILFTELNPIQSTINSLLQKLRELQSEDVGEFAEIEEDSSYVSILNELMQGANGPTLILNSEKNIEHINAEGEDLTGMRESSASGTSLLDSARDQGFAATVIELCDNSANNNGTNQSELYELTGKNYEINVTGLIGKDNFAKAFYISFVLDE